MREFNCQASSKYTGKYLMKFHKPDLKKHWPGLGQWDLSAPDSTGNDDQGRVYQNCKF